MLHGRTEAVIQLPRNVRNDPSDAKGDGVLNKRMACLMTRKNMLITIKKLKEQFVFLKEQCKVSLHVECQSRK